MGITEVQNKAAAAPVVVPENYHPITDRGEFMNPVMREFFRRLLVEKKEELVREIAQERKYLVVTENLPDIVDRASWEMDTMQAAGRSNRRKEIMRAIDIALDLIERGPKHEDQEEYGYSDPSGNEIPIGRLLSAPWLTRNVEDQEAYERHSKMHRGREEVMVIPKA